MSNLKEKVLVDYKENKSEWTDMFKEEIEKKHEVCKVKNKFGKGKNGFNHFKMADMYHNGQW